MATALQAEVEEPCIVIIRRDSTDMKLKVTNFSSPAETEMAELAAKEEPFRRCCSRKSLQYWCWSIVTLD